MKINFPRKLAERASNANVDIGQCVGSCITANRYGTVSPKHTSGLSGRPRPGTYKKLILFKSQKRNCASSQTDTLMINIQRRWNENIIPVKQIEVHGIIIGKCSCTDTHFCSWINSLFYKTKFFKMRTRYNLKIFWSSLQVQVFINLFLNCCINLFLWYTFYILFNSCNIIFL